MKLNDAIWGLLCAVLGLGLLIYVQSFPPMPGQKYGPAVFPGLIAASFVVSGLALIWRGVKAGKPWGQWMPWVQSPTHLLRFFVLLASLVFYILASNWLGFLITGTVCLFVLFITFRVGAGKAALIAFVATLCIHLMFYKVMRVPLPWGVLTPFAW